MLRYLLFAFLLLPQCYAGEVTWVLRRDQVGIAIYQQPGASGYAITQGETVIPASLDAVLTLMRAPSHCPLWVYACKESHIAKQYSLEQRLDYTVIDSPLWFADRDMYIHSTASFDQRSKTFTLKLEGRDKHNAGQSGRVRILELWGFWHLQALAADRTQLSYQIHGNPQLPASPLLDAYMVESVFQTLHNLHNLMQQDQYRHVLPIPELQ